MKHPSVWQHFYSVAVKGIILRKWYPDVWGSFLKTRTYLLWVTFHLLLYFPWKRN